MGLFACWANAQPLRPWNHIGFCLSNVLSILIFIWCLFFQHNISRNPAPQNWDIIERQMVLFNAETGNYTCSFCHIQPGLYDGCTCLKLERHLHSSLWWWEGAKPAQIQRAGTKSSPADGKQQRIVTICSAQQLSPFYSIFIPYFLSFLFINSGRLGGAPLWTQYSFQGAGNFLTLWADQERKEKDRECP